MSQTFHWELTGVSQIYLKAAHITSGQPLQVLDEQFRYLYYVFRDLKSHVPILVTYIGVSHRSNPFAEINVKWFARIWAAGVISGGYGRRQPLNQEHLFLILVYNQLSL